MPLTDDINRLFTAEASIDALEWLRKRGHLAIVFDRDLQKYVFDDWSGSWRSIQRKDRFYANLAKAVQQDN